MRSFSSLVGLVLVSSACAISAVACVGDDPVSGQGAPDAALANDGAPNVDGAPAPTGDASSDAPSADAGADAAAWSPAELGASLVTWLDASRSVAVDASNLVSSWGDVSGSGNTATATGTARPTRMAATLNGHDVITFNGTSTFLTIASSASTSWGTGDYSVFVVARYSNTLGAGASGTAAFWSKTDIGLPRHGLQFIGNSLGVAALDTCVSRVAGNVLDGTKTVNDNAWRVYATRRVVDTLVLRVNGIVDATTTSASIAAENIDQPGQPAYIGGTNVSGTLTQLMIGDMAELLAVKGALPNDKVAKIEAFLKARYGL